MRRAEAGIQVDKFYPPTDWLDNNNKQIDIRKNAENNSIVLLVGHSADFSKYSLLGLLVDTSSGTYDVYIDDVLVGSGITKNTQYDIDFSTINTSYGSATTPEALVLHKIVIKPTTNGSTITRFQLVRTTGVTTNQNQGLLWCHLELSNIINLSSFSTTTYRAVIMKAITSKGNYIELSNYYFDLYHTYDLIYVPIIKKLYARNQTFYLSSRLKRVIAEDLTINGNYVFQDNIRLEQIVYKKCSATAVNISSYSNNNGYGSLKILPSNKYSSGTNGPGFITREILLFPTKIDMTSAILLQKIELNGNSANPMRGLRGLKVSNEAPFRGSSPQINVSYTGLDRDALVELFTSLPTVTGSQILKCDHCTGTADLTEADKQIATDKGWGLTLS